MMGLSYFCPADQSLLPELRHLLANAITRRAAGALLGLLPGPASSQSAPWLLSLFSLFLGTTDVQSMSVVSFGEFFLFRVNTTLSRSLCTRDDANVRRSYS